MSEGKKMYCADALRDIYSKNGAEETNVKGKNKEEEIKKGATGGRPQAIDQILSGAHDNVNE